MSERPGQFSKSACISTPGPLTLASRQIRRHSLAERVDGQTDQNMNADAFAGRQCRRSRPPRTCEYRAHGLGPSRAPGDPEPDGPLLSCPSSLAVSN